LQGSKAGFEPYGNKRSTEFEARCLLSGKVVSASTQVVVSIVSKEDGGLVSMKHLMRATRRECHKVDNVIIEENSEATRISLKLFFEENQKSGDKLSEEGVVIWLSRS
jgi:hypothetical protein